MADTADIPLLDAADMDGKIRNLLHRLLKGRGNVGCAYSLASHTALARPLGASQTRRETAARGTDDRLRACVAGALWAALRCYADSITPTGDGAMDYLCTQLAAPWNASQIVETTSVVALFNYFNRFAGALAIPPTR